MKLENYAAYNWGPIVVHLAHTYNSAYLNPVDYKAEEQRISDQKTRSVRELKQRLTEVLHWLQKTVIGEAADKWRKRPWDFVHASAGNCEHI